MTDAWQAWAWIAWIVSAGLFGYLVFDFWRVNANTTEDVLLSSRENFDELFATTKPDGS